MKDAGERMDQALWARNEVNPRPFTWTKTADEILDSLADYLTKLRTGQPVSGARLTSGISGGTLVPHQATFAR